MIWSFQDWCAIIEKTAKAANPLFDYSHVIFHWSDRYLAKQAPEQAALELVRAAVLQAESFRKAMEEVS